MKFDTLFDPLFLLPFVNGALVALLLPALGVYTRLRDEWLASLGVAQTAAAGVAMASLISSAVTAGALAGAVVAGMLKRMAGRSGNDMYAVLILIGWSAALLAAANSTHGEDFARALIEGQLYVTGRWHWWHSFSRASRQESFSPGCLPACSSGGFFQAISWQTE